MRKIERADAVMMNNVRVLLKRSVFREVSMEDMLAATQAYQWATKFTQEIEQSVGVSEAIAGAKCIDPGPIPVPGPVMKKAKSK